MAPDTDPARPTPGPAWPDLGVIALVMSAALYALSRTVADVDLWGHVKFGEDIWRTGRVIQPDTYSYLTGGQAWINHEWLAEVTFYRIFSSFGAPGLIAFKSGVGLLIVGLVYRHLCRWGLSAARAGVVVLLVAIMLIHGLGTVRPQLFTYLFFLLLLLLIHAAEHGRVRWLWACPVLFALWANLHGGFLAGLAILSIWSGVHTAALVRRAHSASAALSRSTLTVLAALTTTVLATLANPHGAGLLRFLVRPATLARPDISEWQPIAIMSFYGILYLAVLAAAGVGLLYSRIERRPALLVLLACIALLPLTAERHGSLFALGMPVLAAEHLGSAWARWRATRPAHQEARRDRRRQLWSAAIALAFAVAVIRWSLPHFSCIHLDPIVVTFPARAVALLKDSGVSGNMAVLFDWGEYALWHLSPRIKVSVDGRRETVYPDGVRTENLNFLTGIGDWDAVLRNHDTHLALVSTKRPTFNLMTLQPGWRLAYEDSVAAIFAREDPPLIHQLRRTSPRDVPHDGKGLCFP
jgi:hypothetical protein